jgi:SM-20-related protein
VSSTPTPAGAAQPRIVRHPCLHIDNFLDASSLAFLMDSVFRQESVFRPSAVSDGKGDYRRSLVMQAPRDIEMLMLARIRQVIPDAIRQVRVPAFDVSLIECQVTANNDGSYFRVHTDAGDPTTIRRVFTYVYYFNHQPRAFEGGDLRLYDDQIRNNKFARIDSFQVIEPRHNSIVFFNAAVMHEVTPVRVPSGLFRDSRFTVNGWVHRA